MNTHVHACPTHVKHDIHVFGHMQFLNMYFLACVHACVGYPKHPPTNTHMSGKHRDRCVLCGGLEDRCVLCGGLERESTRCWLAAAIFVKRHGAAVIHLHEGQQCQLVPFNSMHKISFLAYFMWIFATNVDISYWIIVVLLCYMFCYVDK